MIPVYQTNDPGRFGPTDNGDCLRACLASLLELPLKAVPHFMETAEKARTWPIALAKWLHGRGLDLDVLHPPGDVPAVLKYMAAHHPSEHYMLLGRSGPDFGHVVIGKGGKIVHDPSRRGAPGASSPIIFRPIEQAASKTSLTSGLNSIVLSGSCRACLKNV